MIKALLFGIVALFGVYLAATCLLFVTQRRMIYPAPVTRASEEVAPEFHAAMLHTSDGLALRAIYRPARGELPTIVFFHGNGDSLRGALAATHQLGSAGYGILLPEYRGYGGNPGSPSETGLYRDAEAALQWLQNQHVAFDKTIVIGNSLGSGVATEMAARHPVAGLVLISGFTSLTDVAASHMSFFPVRLLLRDRYENLVKLPRVTAPILLLHGRNDSLIKADQAYALAHASKRGKLVVINQAGHELAYLPQSQSEVLQWLQTE